MEQAREVAGTGRSTRTFAQSEVTASQRSAPTLRRRVAWQRACNVVSQRRLGPRDASRGCHVGGGGVCAWCACVCTCACLWACMRACVYARAHSCTCVRASVRVCAREHTHACARTRTHTQGIGTFVDWFLFRHMSDAVIFMYSNFGYTAYAAAGRTPVMISNGFYGEAVSHAACTRTRAYRKRTTPRAQTDTSGRVRNAGSPANVGGPPQCERRPLHAQAEKPCPLVSGLWKLAPGYRSGQVRFIARPKSRTMRATRQLRPPPRYRHT